MDRNFRRGGVIVSALVSQVPEADRKEEEERQPGANRVRSSSLLGLSDVVGVGRHRASVFMHWQPDSLDIHDDDSRSQSSLEGEPEEDETRAQPDESETPWRLRRDMVIDDDGFSPELIQQMVGTPKKASPTSPKAQKPLRASVSPPKTQNTDSTRQVRFASTKRSIVADVIMKFSDNGQSENLPVNTMERIDSGGIVGDFIMKDYREKVVKRGKSRWTAKTPEELVRWYARGQGKDDATAEPDMSDESDTSSSSSGAERPEVYSGNTHVDVAVRLAHREKILQTLQKEVLQFWKKSESDLDAPYRRSLRKSMKSKASEVVKVKHESRCLEVELNSMMLRRKLLDGPKAHTIETDVDAKIESQKTFWTLFHAEDREHKQAKHQNKGTTPHQYDSSRMGLSSPSSDAAASLTKLPALPTSKGSQRAVVQNNTRQRVSDVSLESRPQSMQRSQPRLSNSCKELKQWSAVSPNFHDSLAPSARNRSTRMMVTHRKDVHQQRLETSELSTSSASWALSPIARSEKSSPKHDSPSSSSEEDEELMGSAPSQYFDAGRFLEPSLRRDRCNRVRSRSKFLSPKVAAHSHAAHHLEQHLRALNIDNGEIYRDPGLAKVKSMRTSASEGSLHRNFDSVHRLPPVFEISNPFKVPWRTCGASNAASKTNAFEAAKQYIQMCKDEGIVPTPFALEMARREKLLAAGKNLSDSDLAALTAMIPLIDKMEDIDLSHNIMLSDEALTAFLQSCFGWPVAGTLHKMVLDSCKGFGAKSSDQLVRLLTNSDTGLHKLLHLNISNFLIPTGSLSALCGAIRQHGALQELHMADTGLGFNPFVRTCMAELLLAPELVLLDLGWNWFTEDVFDVLGAAVCAHKKLTTLTLASCSGSRPKGGDVPIAAFLEHLSRDIQLATLDLSLNQIDARCALVLEDALEIHPQLTDLRMSQNPLGADGMRCILRLLSRDSSGLLQFDCASCYTHSGESGESAESCFNPTRLSGRYEMNLRQPYGRAVFRMLYKACERLQLNPTTAFADLEYELSNVSVGARASQKSTYQHPTGKDEYGIWCVPTTGTVHTKFSISEALAFRIEDEEGNLLPELRPHNISRSDSAILQSSRMPPMLATAYIRKYLDAVYLKPGFRKIVPLLMQFRSFKGEQKEQELLVDALSHDFILKIAHIEQLYISKAAPVDVLARLLPCTMDSAERFMVLSLAKGLEEYIKVFTKCQHLIVFQAENPTGHYNLDMGNPADHSVFETILLIDQWDALSAQQRGCADMSIDGSWSGIRNAVYQNAKVSRLHEVHLPTCHHVHFDYSSFRRPPLNSCPISDDCWTRLLTHLELSRCPGSDKVSALRFIAPQVYISCLQLRQLLGTVECGKARADLLITFVFRIVDPQNMKIFYARLGEFVDRLVLINRLGTCAAFPYFQPEEALCCLDLSTYEGRVATSLFVHLAHEERISNMRGLSYLRSDSTYHDFVMGVPLSWENMDSVPTSGLFKFRYVCSPEERKLQLRKHLAVKHGGWRIAEDLHADDVVWWSALSEAPEHVLNFLYYTIRDFSNVWECYSAIAAFGTTAPHSFKEAVDSFGWRKFKHRPKRLMKVFRYLDPNDSSIISEQEWAVLHQLWKELMLSILEIAEYLDRHFSGNFNVAWSVIDSAGRGEVDRDGWTQVVELIGYFGESAPIFNYLCDSKGRLTSAGWKKLKHLWADRESLRKNIFNAFCPE